MDKLTPAQARKRFGEIVHAGTRTFREFNEPAGGIWRPVFVDGELERYQLYQVHKVSKRLSFRKRR